jgi:hypothetical protein
MKDRNLSGPGAALASLLTPISTLLLRSGLGFGDLMIAAKDSYVRAALRNVSLSEPKVSISHLAVVTGLSRKEIAGILKQQQAGIENKKRKNEQRVLRVVRGWMMDPRFTDKRGRPSGLRLRGERNSFSQLVKSYGGDVTPNSVLRELKGQEMIHFSRAGLIRLRTVGHVRKVDLPAIAQLLEDFIETVTPNGRRWTEQPYFGFREAWVPSSLQTHQFHRKFSKRASALLQSVDQWSKTNVRRNRETPTSNERRVGIGVYLVGQATEEPESSLRRAPINSI